MQVKIFSQITLVDESYKLEINFFQFFVGTVPRQVGKSVKF